MSATLIRLAARYSVLCRRIAQLRRMSAALYSRCELPSDVVTGPAGYDTITVTCIDHHFAALNDWRKGQADSPPDKPLQTCINRYFKLPTGPEGERPRAEPFCRHCTMAWRATRHRKDTMVRRRAAVLGAIRRAGAAIEREP